MITANGRTADYPDKPMFLERWSPRVFIDLSVPEGYMDEAAYAVGRLSDPF